MSILIQRPSADRFGTAGPSAAGSAWAALEGWRGLALALAVAAGMRLAALGFAPLWGDEAATAAFAGLPWDELWGGLGRLEPNPPGFYALEKLWAALAGSSELALRLPAAAFGIAGVAVVWALARDTLGRRAAFWAALLVALNPQHLEHARDARAYSLLFLLVAAAASLAFRIARSPSQNAGQKLGRWTGWRACAGLAAVAGAAMWVHYTAAIALACVFLAAGTFALRQPGALPRLLRLASAGCAGLVLGAPALARMAAVAGDPANNAAWIPQPDGFMTLLFTVSTWTVPYASVRDMPPEDGVRLMGVGLGVAGLVLAWCLRSLRASPGAAGLLAGLGAAVVLMAGASQVRPILVEQTLLFSLVFFLPLLGATVAALSRAGQVGLLAALLLAQAPSFARIYEPVRHGEDWAGLAAELQSDEIEAGWPVIVRSGMDAMTLDRFLPAGSAALPAVSITPRIGGRLSERVARQLTAALPLPEETSPDTLCAAIGHPGGAYLLAWRNALPKMEQRNAEALLLDAGGHMADSTAHGILILQRWPGVCRPDGASPG